MGMTRTVVGLVQINEVVWERRSAQRFRLRDGVLVSRSSSSGLSTALAFLPHAAGLLQGFVQKKAREPGRYTFLRPLHRRIPVEEAVEHLVEADIVGFSAYVWNVRLSLAIARMLKASRPDATMIFGGPQGPDRAEDFHREHPYVDVVCHGEGERTFLEVLENREARDWSGVASLSYLDRSGRFVRTPPRPRMTDLDEIPSPYLEGVFDDLMRSAPGQPWLVTWETNRGCPFSCTFCDWGSATASKVFRFGMERLDAEIEWFAGHGINHLFVCDANFGILPRDVEIAEKIASAWERRNTFVTVSIQNTKNRTERSVQIHRILRRCRSVAIGANVSLQTVTPEVLTAIRRDNISQKAFERLHNHFAAENRDCYTELIIGLPGETYPSFAEGVAQVIRNGQYNRITFYECSLLPNAEMSEPEYRALHGIEHKPSRLVHAYEPLGWSERDEVPEYLDVVVSTRTMTNDDWVRSRVFANLVELLFYDRLLQVPLTVLGAGLGLDYRRMFERFLDCDGDRFPIVDTVRRLFSDHARELQSGGPQFVASAEWLNIWWPTDQHALIAVVKGGHLDELYSEARDVLTEFARQEGADLDPLLLNDALLLNRSMLALPFQLADRVVELNYALDEIYQTVQAGRPTPLRRQARRCRIEHTAAIWLSWEDWYEDLIHRTYVRKSYSSPISPVADRDRPDAVAVAMTAGAT
jgi:radical SAM superfamily enzyme YgiQ (UPF0313 family)